MSADLIAPAPAGRRFPTAPNFELRAAAIFWRVFLVALLVREYAVWRYISKFVPRDEPLLRMWGFVKHSPKSFQVAFLVGAGATIGVALGFRLIGRPLMRRWYHPRPIDPMHEHLLPFHLAPGEAQVAEYPARRLDGLTRHPGTFVQTDRRLWFFPFSWEQEPWSVSLDRLKSARTEPTTRRVLGLVRGYPNHVCLTDADGATFRLIVADPRRLLDMLRP